MPSTPRGYWAEEYPLPHINHGYFGLTMMTAINKQSTILPLFRSTEKLVNPENVAVNPRNTAFALETGLSCYVGSIIPKTSFSLTAKLSTGAIETDKIREAVFYWWPLYTTFVENLDASDSKTSTTVGDLVELIPSAGDKQVKPNYNGTDLTTQSIELISSGAEAFASWGLTTDDKLEGVTTDHATLLEAMRFYTIKGMIGTTVGRMRRVRLSRDKGYHFHSNNFTQPKVKRMNEYTMCAIMIHVPPKDTSSDGHFNINQGNTISNIDHIIFNYRIAFDEWNSNFDQGAQ